ncbi:hypothetical protein LJC60_09645, partial [Ruminococcaceae bacterium OttesenSCG-928-D13]|nr:hypothetical protein [Ruminococcaceae bacterium OttesenSCG-928-D13]
QSSRTDDFFEAENNDEQSESQYSLEVLLSYSAFVAFFITVLKVYIERMYHIFFSAKDRESDIFPSIGVFYVLGDKRSKP